MKVLGALAFVLLLAATPVLTAEESWSGQISDSLCRKAHEEDADAAAGGKQGIPDEHECTLACVRGGSKYVFVANDKVYQIANQTEPSLQTHAGHHVTLTGEMKGDIITVSKIEMAADAAR